MSKLSHHEVMVLLIQLSTMLLIGRLFAEIARRLKQPAVVGELIAGIMIGPTVLGMIEPSWFHTLFPPSATSGVVLAGFVQVAVVMLLFIAGLEVDLHIVWQQGRQSILTSLWVGRSFLVWVYFALSISRFFWIGR